MPGSGAPHPSEFRRLMVVFAWAGRAPEEPAGEFEPSARAIRNTVDQAERDAGRRTDGPTGIEREEPRRRVWKNSRGYQG